MRSTQKNVKNSDRQTGQVQSGGLGSNLDVAAKALLGAGKKAGNAATGDKIDGTAASRDQLLARVMERLQVMAKVQKIEQAELQRPDQWKREVAKGEEGFHLPDPTRWHGAAKLYRQAAQALSRGQLGRGAELLDQAQDAERAAFQSLPEMVTDQLKAEAAPAGESEAIRGHISPTAACPTSAVPAAILFEADKILSVTDRPEKAVPLPRFGKWWQGLGAEEEEEEDEAAKNGAGAAKNA